ncbi:MAG: ThuA domain-containing protein [Planctomycetes bacterium]|nr:ThuA domain-containing protein [Planctomycetota bacterium]
MRLLLVAIFCAIICGGSLVPAEAAKPLKVCILSGCDTYKSEKSLPPFQKFLEANYNVHAVRVVREAEDDLPGLEQLDDCDVALVFIKRMQLKGEQLERFKRYATSGRPIVAIRTASHAVQTWLEFDRQVLGGNYQSHYDRGITTTVEVVPEAGKHPILAGVSISPVQDPLYKNSGHADDIHVLLRGTIPNQLSEPVAWTRDYKNGRIVYTSLGAEDTFEQPGFRRLLANALFWTARREVETKKR